MAHGGVIQTRTSSISMGEDGVVCNKVNGLVIDQADIEEWHAAYVALGKGAPVRVLLDITDFTSVTPAARRFAASQAHADTIEAAAILIGSPVGRVAGNFWLRINKPRFRARLFTQTEAARAWLEQGDV